MNQNATPTATGQYTQNQWLPPDVTYDLAGNQTAPPAQTFSYDGENRLTGSTQPYMVPTVSGV